MLFACCNKCSTIKQLVIFAYIFITAKKKTLFCTLVFSTWIALTPEEIFIFPQVGYNFKTSFCLLCVIHSTHASAWPPHHLIHLLRCTELQGMLHGNVDSSNKTRKKEPSLLPKQGWDVKGHPALLPQAHYVMSFFLCFSNPLPFL